MLVFFFREQENRPLELLPTLQQVAAKKLVFHNVNSLQTNHLYVSQDSNVLAADVLIFVESHVCEGDRERFGLPGFDWSYFNERRMR